MAQDEVLAHVRDGIGEITLNRPKALNSLNANMVLRLRDIYQAWEQPGSGVNCIVVRGAGGKAYCAGGDVKQVVQQAAAGGTAAALHFFKQEYLVDAALGRLARPHVALLDGIVMGGGAGISMHGSFRVATEKSVFAMPEVGIGLFPDVGMMAVLARLNGRLGEYLALTGARLTGIQLKEAGLATHYLPSASLPALLDSLHRLGVAAADHGAVRAVLQGAEAAAGPPPPPSGLLGRLPVVSRCFGVQGGVPEVLRALGSEGEPDPEFRAEALQQILRGSPLSAAVSLEFLRRVRAGSLDLHATLELDYTLVGHFVHGRGDFWEGVRARLIDKDDKPCWKHASAEQVPAGVVSSFFVPLDPEDSLDRGDGCGSKSKL